MPIHPCIHVRPGAHLNSQSVRIISYLYFLDEQTFAACTVHISWNLGWGLLTAILQLRYFFVCLFNIIKYWLHMEDHFHVWQVPLPQPTRGDTCQMWMLFQGFFVYFSKMRNISKGEITEEGFWNPPLDGWHNAIIIHSTANTRYFIVYHIILSMFRSL